MLQSDETVAAIAAEAFATLGSGRQITPFSQRFREFALADAYRVTPQVRARREARGEKVVGRKIGFTNRTIWKEYEVYAPMWGYVYDRTVSDLAASGGVARLDRLAEPRIEPEIIFGLKSAPSANMDLKALIDCVEWVAHGFEIVQSIFPAWKFSAADTVAAYGLHGALFVGPRLTLPKERRDWVTRLANFEIDLFRNGETIDHGRAANVLDSPLNALRHLVEVLAADPVNPPLEANEIVTTGTLTRAFPVAAGETWSTKLEGMPLEPAKLRFI
jgi:2-oxo-3-hexenedioate decarboxylase